MAYSSPEAQRAAVLKVYHDRRNAFILSRGGCCERCGSIDRLEIDHIDPALKSMSPGRAFYSRAEVREVELSDGKQHPGTVRLSRTHCRVLRIGSKCYGSTAVSKTAGAGSTPAHSAKVPTR